MNLLWGPELIQIYNDAYAPLMGLKHPAGLGQPAAECWQEVWEVAGPLYVRVFAGETVVLENSQWILNRHGVPEAAWFDNYLIPVLDENGAIGGALAIAFETTGRVKAAEERDQSEQALRASEARLQAAIDLVGLSPYTWDPATGALDWDARLKAMWGLPPDAHVDEEVFLSGIHPEDRPRVEAAIAQCSDPAGPGIYAIEYRVIGIEDGVERWVSTHGRTTFENGRPVGFIGAALDITARKRAEAALRESEERFRQFAENSSNTLWILNFETMNLEYLSPLSRPFGASCGRERSAIPAVGAASSIRMIENAREARLTWSGWARSALRSSASSARMGRCAGSATPSSPFATRGPDPLRRRHCPGHHPL